MISGFGGQAVLLSEPFHFLRGDDPGVTLPKSPKEPCPNPLAQHRFRAGVAGKKGLLQPVQ
jgi:hypothetical protein